MKTLEGMSMSERAALSDRVAAGALLPEEEAEIKRMAAALGKSTGAVLADLKSAMINASQNAAREMRTVGDAMKALGGSINNGSAVRQQAERKRTEGVPLDRWSTVELMSFLPKMPADCEPQKLDDFQLACYTQHILNNCSKRKENDGSYDGALQGTYAPELIRRLLTLPDETPLQKMRMAWSLFRTGAATLDEIIPLMDRADDGASAPPKHEPAIGPADGLIGAQYLGYLPTVQNRKRRRPYKIPRALGVIGEELVADGIPYRVVARASVEPKNVMLQELHADDDKPIDGATFMVDLV